MAQVYLVSENCSLNVAMVVCWLGVWLLKLSIILSGVWSNI